MLIDWLKNRSQSHYVPGHVFVNARACTGCRQCTIVCPASALEMTDKKKSHMKSGADCISCGACTAVCASDAIRIASFYHVPDGIYQTLGRRQKVGEGAFPRDFAVVEGRRK